VNIFDLLWIVLLVAGGTILGAWLFGWVGALSGAALGSSVLFALARMGEHADHPK
jgi:glucose-6-phosphate-specific signal transduction histidine kinase